MTKGLGTAIAGVLALMCFRPALAERYFDAHNHITGVLPYYAYANLPEFTEHFWNPQATVRFEDRSLLFHYLADTWYWAQERDALGSKLFSPPDGQRFAVGGRATLEVFEDKVDAGSTVDVNGALERVLTATPWSEFDSAYAFRGGPASAYLLKRFYADDPARLNTDLCRATVLELAATHIDDSEQSLPFIGGWRLNDGKSWPLETIQCVMDAPTNPVLLSALHTMNRDMPSIKVVLMTHTAQLAALPGGTAYSEWSKDGTCQSIPLVDGLVTTPKTVYNALMGWDTDGTPVLPAYRLPSYFNTVVGIDTAGPETTCFTPAGMAYYQDLIGAVYAAAKARRLTGWHGKLLVHTHVGEGAVIDYAPAAPPLPWTFQSMFAMLPPTRSNSAQAQANLSALLSAVAAFELAHPDVRNYVVFRFAHDTWATTDQAQAMHDDAIEADVNLESNVATGAYPLNRMPLGAAAARAEIDPVARNPATNFELNDLLHFLVKDPANAQQVGTVLGNVSLRYLLEARVRCILGTDADGVEHSDIVKEYQYATSLVAYWNRTDPQFAEKSGNADIQTLLENARWHLANMASDTAARY
ncbi:MAG TPA: hypothetical protein VMV37_14630 [Gammaproteobacteria bacterium]|nr:hypothetical protein [Gammaproteobacteria bacterium]